MKKSNEVFAYGLFKFKWEFDNNLVVKIKYFMKKELYNKDNNENRLHKNDEYDTNCEWSDTLALIATKTDHYPNKSIGVFLSVIEEE